jgi:2-methylcitrate dehydratase PrpD
MPTIVEQLAGFAAGSSYDALPPEVAGETKRLVLDSLGCALAAVDEPKGRIGMETAALMGSGSEATILGAGTRSSIFGAAFANGELITDLLISGRWG